MKEQIRWNPVWTIEKYRNDEDFRAGKPFEVNRVQGNLLLNNGITRLLNLLIGESVGAFDNANARIGVGDGSTAEDPSQTALVGSNTLFKGMDAGFPSVSGQTVSFRATFGAAEANFDWEEFCVEDGDGLLLNRKVDSQGTKQSGQTWVITMSITIS